MLARLRLVLFVAIAAVVGALAGRVAAEARRRAEAGEDPADIDIMSLRIRPQDLVPGLVAAVRVRDTPWSWLHVPSWLAAFSVNFGVTAVGGDLSKLREMAERAAFSFAGLQIPGLDTSPGPTPFEARHEPVEGYPGAAASEPASTTWAAPDLGATADGPPSPGFTPFRG